MTAVQAALLEPPLIPDNAARIAALTKRVLARLRPPPRLRLSQWADEKFHLSAESAAEPGRWRTLPYQVGILDAVTDPLVEHVSVMKSARVGFTKCLNVIIGYHMEHDPCPIMVVQPTIEDAEGYSKEEIAPMLRDCPALAVVVPEAKAKDGNNTILHKLFRGGSLTMVGANSPRGFRRTSRRIVLFDEVDGYPPSAGSEGDQIQLGIRRTEYYWNRKLVYGSTPTIAGVSRIEALFLAGDQRRYWVPCPHCDEMQVLKFAQFRWPNGRPREAVYVCAHCGAEIEHARKRDMVHAGEWRAEAPFTGHASFHIWAAYSFSPNATWGQLCEEFVSVQKVQEKLKTYVNTVLGETWKEKGEAPAWQRLYERRERYAMGHCPDGVLFLTCGVDVQKDRLVYEVVGWGRDRRSWSIDIGVIPGDTALLNEKGPWRGLNVLLGRMYPHQFGGTVPIRMLAVDSGFNTQTVYNWAREQPLTRVIAVKGVDRAGVLVGAPSDIDILSNGRRSQRGYKVWPVCGGIAKSELYGALKLSRATDEEIAAGAPPSPPGYCHFPEYGEDFFKQLTAEQLVVYRNRRGFTVATWELIPGRENHYLDCRIYARAAAYVVGIDKFTEADWTSYEQAVRVGPSSDAPPSTPAPRASRVGRSNYLQR